MWGSVLWGCAAGEDPLTDQPVDMDSVAGVLKLYFRTLKNPLFPLESTSQLLEAFRKCVLCVRVCQCILAWWLTF